MPLYMVLALSTMGWDVLELRSRVVNHKKNVFVCKEAEGLFPGRLAT